MDASVYFRNKKITVMGLGLLGRGLGDAKFLAECGAELIVTDLKSPEELTSSIDALVDVKEHITFVFGQHRLEDFRNRDLILKAAGVPSNSPFIKEAEAHAIPIRMSADLFVEYAGIPVIGITGTRGKSTTTHMLAAILEAAGKKVILGGNVRGVSTLALLAEVRGDEIAVLELDSWQLQGFGTAEISPHVAVFTTFYPDHLNYYANDLNAYLADKANIFLHQNGRDTLVLGSQASNIVQEKYRDSIPAELCITDENDLPSDWQLKVPGAHNRYDAACALAAVRAMGVPDEISRKALMNFVGIPGRLQLVREVGDIKIYNDTNSTTPEATLAALRALKGNIVLVMGGNDKNLDMNELLLEIPEHTKRVILLPGTGTNRILEFLPSASVFDTLNAAIREALAVAVPGDSILFSPAFTSFGLFKNEYDRGEQFNKLVEAL